MIATKLIIKDAIGVKSYRHLRYKYKQEITKQNQTETGPKKSFRKPYEKWIREREKTC